MYYLIQDTYDRAGILPIEILDLSFEIIIRVARENIQKALELFYIIEVDSFKLEALHKIKSFTNNTTILEEIKSLEEGL